MGNRFCIALAVFAVTLATGLPAAAGPALVGSVKTAEGACFVVRGGTQFPVSAGERLFLSDTLRTGGDGRLGAILRDDTTLSLGPDTELRVECFAFEPARGELEMVLRMLKGMASYISGQIAKLAPDAVRFETPVATVGVRGTRFLARVTPE
ncbi:MAG: FecR family protein [Deferrisomatales bacterium]|nr:FecR family protein [Deferrisomatales bacterium]